MTISFERPIGAHADVKELEYVSALQQTCIPTLRNDGSIVVEDVCRLLLSRHGIQVTPKVVEDLITTELAGDPEEQPKGCVDLRQLVGILLIPDLKRALHHRTTTNVDADNGIITTPLSLFHQILHIILTDIGMIQQQKQNTITSMEDTMTPTPALTIELIKTTLAIYGETSVPSEVLEENYSKKNQQNSFGWR